MKKQIYKKSNRVKNRLIIRLFGLVAVFTGLGLGMYTFFPLISYELYIKPAFASQSFAAPIPKTTIITQDYIQSLLRNTASSIGNIAKNNGQGWIPSAYKEMAITTQMSNYNLSIPVLGIDNAYVSTIDVDVDNHLVHFPGTAIPPATGNAAIFGHSTLPQWFDPGNYKAIFATAHTLKDGDLIKITVNNQVYNYKIMNISIVDAEDTSYLHQDTDGSYITIITCTPPGTTWKRLLIKAKLE